MHVTSETVEQTDKRLMGVLREAEMLVLPALWRFDEFDGPDFQERMRMDALALIRDGDRWSQLVPATADEQELLTVWSFHFESGIDNSGFVGWLASWIKRELGSGVAVVCGQNSARGGIFDYWCCPAEVGEPVIARLRAMRMETARA